MSRCLCSVRLPACSAIGVRSQAATLQEGAGNLGGPACEKGGAMPAVLSGPPVGPAGPCSYVGLQVSAEKAGERVAASRAAELIATAAYHALDEAWITQHPVLLMGESSS